MELTRVPSLLYRDRFDPAQKCHSCADRPDLRILVLGQQDAYATSHCDHQPTKSFLYFLGGNQFSAIAIVCSRGLGLIDNPCNGQRDLHGDDVGRRVALALRPRPHCVVPEQDCPAHPLGWPPGCNARQHCEYRPAGGQAEQEHRAEIFVPRGRFMMGSPADEPGRDPAEEPAHLVTFARGFFLDKYEATVERHGACERELGCAQPRITAGGDPANRAPDQAHHPQNGLTWAQAQAFCVAQGGRLPSEAEWEYAASGPLHRRYPWGDGPDPSCDRAVMQDGAVGCLGERTAEVGTKPDGLSAVGALDMAGNVREWTEDCWQADHAGAPDDGRARTRECTEEGQAVCRGEGYASEDPLGFRTARRVGGEREAGRNDTGVRCVRDRCPPQLVAAWSFEDQTPTEETGRLLLEPGPAQDYPEGPQGRCLHNTDGSGPAATVALVADDPLQLQEDDFEIDFSGRLDASAQGIQFGTAVTDGGSGWAVRLNSSKNAAEYRFLFDLDGRTVLDVDFSPAEWHRFRVIREEGWLAMELDGIEQERVRWSPPTPQAAFFLGLPSHVDNRSPYTAGFLDEITITRQRSACQPHCQRPNLDCPVHPLGWPPRCNAQGLCEYQPLVDNLVRAEQEAELFLPAGSFLMGSPPEEVGRDPDEGPVHRVTFRQGFFLGKYELTVERYQECHLPDCTTPRADAWDGFGWGVNRLDNGRADHPQNGLNWSQAGAVCAGIGGRLPSEAEWEYAASGPLHRRFPWGADPPDCTRAVFDTDDVEGRPGVGCDPCDAPGCSGTKPVGSVPAGAAWSGAQDMAGNVMEWCQDWHQDSYAGAPTDGTAWTDPSALRVLRGFSSNNPADSLRTASRYAYWPNDFSALDGVRCARDLR